MYDISIGFLLLGPAILAAVIAVGARGFYQLGFDAGRRAAEVALFQDELRMIHWLATNGFQRLLLIGEKRETGGFRDRTVAERAHYALDRLESHLPKDEVVDRSFDRMGTLRMRWTDAPRHPAGDLVWNERLKNEP